MDIIIDQQVALDEALVPYASRLRIGKSNFRLRSYITSKESTLQMVYDVLRPTPFYKVFLVTTDVPEIYMQEFWETATVHHHSIHFKMDKKKRIVNLEYFREMLHICPRLPGQTFDELSFEEEILAFLRFLGHSGEIRKLTDAQILWGMYHKKNVDFAYLMWEDFIYQVEHKDAKKRNEMYYPSVMLLVELTNEDIRNSKAYKEYYAIASGAVPPKTKASVRKTKSSSDTTITPLTVADTRLSTSVKGKQPTKSSKAKDEGTGIIPGVLDVPTNESDEEISWKSSDEDDDDEADDDDQDDDDQDDNDDDQDTDNDSDNFVHSKLSIHKEEAKDEESFDPTVQTPKNYDDEGNDDASLGMNVGDEEGHDAEDDDEELYRDVNINLEGRDVQMTDVYTTQEFEDTYVTLTPVNPNGQQQSSLVSSQFVTSMLNLSPDAGIDSLFMTTPWVDVQASTTVASLTLTAPTLPPPTDLPNFGSLFGFDHRLKTLKANFSEFVQTNQFAGAVSYILGIVERYMDQQMNKAVKQVKEQVKVQVSKILPKIEKTVNEQLEAKVLSRSSNSSKTSYVVAADLSEMELKKILIEKMESNKTLRWIRPRVQKTKRRKRARVKKRSKGEGDQDHWQVYSRVKSHQKTASKFAPVEEPMQTTQDLEEPSHQEFKTDVTDDQPIPEASQHPKWSLVELEFFLEEVYKATTDQLEWNNPEGQRYPHNLLKPLPLIPNSRGRRVIPFDHFINNDLEYLRGGASSRVKSYQKKLNLTKPDTYRSDLKRKEAYTAYSNPRGFIYQNKDKQNWVDAD
uniref:Monodehydroascorbate reductase n=1 Tax=Tanacetum cinerariifolium TaxID=118510 RepID=A0A6L2MSC0_TANCI|nr:hypothetical protein [Tanacetum cinerariifolium]